jgi:hypothetical protein
MGLKKHKVEIKVSTFDLNCKKKGMKKLKMTMIKSETSKRVV